LLEKTYIQNCSPRTLGYFRQSYKTYKRVFPEPALPTADDLTVLVVKLREGGMSAGCCNSYFKGLNSFFDWLHHNNHTPERLRLKLHKTDRRIMRSSTDDELKRLFTYKPKKTAEERVQSLLCLLADTGIRIDEALTLKRSRVDLQNLVITV